MQMDVYKMLRLIVGDDWKQSPLSHLNKSQILLAIGKWNEVFRYNHLPYRYMLGGDGMIITTMTDELAMKLFNSM